MDGLGDEKDSQQRNKMLQHVNAMFAYVGEVGMVVGKLFIVRWRRRESMCW